MAERQNAPCLICSRSLVLCDTAREPRQVRKEAAVSGQPYVPQINLCRLQTRHGDFFRRDPWLMSPCIANGVR